MEEENIVYPNREHLELLINYLKNPENVLTRLLPVCNEKWYIDIIGTVDRVAVPYIQGVSSKAAHLFYYIIKDHSFPDGNKRSGVVMAYLFLLVNGYEVSDADRIRILAKKVAQSHGAKNKDDWIRKIEKEFSYIVKPR